MRLMLPEAVILVSHFLLTEVQSFSPESTCVTCAGSNFLPPPYNLSVSQTKSQLTGNSNSFWSSSFLHGDNNHDYCIISHVLDSGLPNITFYRASVLDITDPSIYAQFTNFSNGSNIYSPQSGVFNFSTSDFGFGSINSTDPLSQLRTWSTVPGVEFDLTFETSSPALLNGGLGMFEATGGLGYEWSMPAGTTTGSFVINGETVFVDSVKSSTWYDREWGNVAQSWVWFEIHLESIGPGKSGIDMSVWVWKDNISGDKQFATVRETPGVHTVIPVMSLQPSNRTFTSPTTGAIYPLDFELNLIDGTKLSISSVRPDQELFDQKRTFIGYEGYAIVTGSYKSIPGAHGYGIIEQVLPSVLGG